MDHERLLEHFEHRSTRDESRGVIDRGPKQRPCWVAFIERCENDDRGDAGHRDDLDFGRRSIHWDSKSTPVAIPLLEHGIRRSFGRKGIVELDVFGMVTLVGEFRLRVGAEPDRHDRET